MSDTARQIIEARVGRKLPPVSQMARDERTAVLRLGLELARQNRSRANEV